MFLNRTLLLLVAVSPQWIGAKAGLNFSTPQWIGADSGLYLSTKKDEDIAKCVPTLGSYGPNVMIYKSNSHLCAKLKWGSGKDVIFSQENPAKLEQVLALTQLKTKQFQICLECDATPEDVSVVVLPKRRESKVHMPLLKGKPLTYTRTDDGKLVLDEIEEEEEEAQSQSPVKFEGEFQVLIFKTSEFVEEERKGQPIKRFGFWFETDQGTLPEQQNCDDFGVFSVKTLTMTLGRFRTEVKFDYLLLKDKDGPDPLVVFQYSSSEDRSRWFLRQNMIYLSKRARAHFHFSVSQKSNTFTVAAEDVSMVEHLLLCSGINVTCVRCNRTNEDARGTPRSSNSIYRGSSRQSRGVEDTIRKRGARRERSFKCQSHTVSDFDRFMEEPSVSGEWCSIV